MARILNSEDCKKAIYNLIDQASKYIVFISPFASVDSGIYKYCMKNRKDGVLVQFFVKTTKEHHSIYENEETDLNYNFKVYGSQPNTLLHRLPNRHCNFHCKCYFNESDFLITSLNLSYFDRYVPSYELGSIFNKFDDPVNFSRCMDWFYNEFCYGINFNYQKDLLSGNIQLGTCIKCGVNIPYKKNYPPFCVQCWYENLDDIENNYSSTYHFCYKCGSSNGFVTEKQPICAQCRGLRPSRLSYELRY